jgi:hypothetical protein
MNKTNIIQIILWTALVALALVVLYAIGSIGVWLIQQTIVVLWSAIAPQPARAVAAVVVVIAALAIINRERQK